VIFYEMHSALRLFIEKNKVYHHVCFVVVFCGKYPCCSWKDRNPKMFIKNLWIPLILGIYQKLKQKAIFDSIDSYENGYTQTTRTRGNTKYHSVLSKWECIIKMRSAFLAPTFPHNSRKDGGKKGRSHLNEILSFWQETTVYSHIYKRFR